MAERDARDLILCDRDGCEEPATRMFIQGPSSKRRFTCNPCGENNEVLFAEGRVGNAPLRECSIREALKAIRRQAWKLGLISQQRYAALCRWHPEW